MKKTLTIILAIALVMSTATTGAFASQGHWGQDSIQRMAALGILQGYEDGTFRPDQILNQNEVAVILDRMQQKRPAWQNDEWEYDEDDGMLAGVPGWAKNAVKKGFQHQYINMNRFHSDVQCDRLLVAVQLAKALGLDPVDPEDFDTNPFNFNDRQLISDEDYGYLLAMYNAGYMKGYPNGNFNPNFLMSRAQMAKILDNVFNGDGDYVWDKTAPVWPAQSAVTASAIDTDRVTLQWTAATDNEGVTVYKITYKDIIDKEKFANTSRTTTITGLTPDRLFTFTVYARDAAGNWSASGPSVQVRTLAAVPVTITAIGAIIGEARAGEVLTAGALTPSNATVTYQWMISDIAAGTYAAITGATNKTYTPIEADTGRYLKVSATGTGAYTGTVTSEATLPVAVSHSVLETMAAISAINNAMTDNQMRAAILAYATVLGLNLTDYNALVDRGPVHEALFAPVFTDLAGIKTAFETAVALQKVAEAD